MTQSSGQRWTAAQARTAFAQAPVIHLDALAPRGPLLVVAPHPDDESLGCGGLIACAAAAGREVTVAVLTDGAASHPNSRAFPPQRLAQVRRAEIDEAVAQLGDGRVRVEAFGAADGRLEAAEGEAGRWLEGLGAFAAVFTSWAADPHPDHKAAFRIAAHQAAAWGAPVFAYPIWGLTLEDDADVGLTSPCVRLDVGAALERKQAAIAAHRSQTTALIADDPSGFRLTQADVARHLERFEVFMRVR